MHLFDHEIETLLPLLSVNEKKNLPLTDTLLEDVGKNNMIFRDETAYELGGGQHIGLSFELPTSRKELIPREGVVLLGKDLNEIRSDTDFARITFLEVKEENLNGEALYDRLETIRFTKYRVNPEGYMLRTTRKGQEKVRVSKETSRESFSKIGSAYIKAYRQIPSVNRVMILFVTGESEYYSLLKTVSDQRYAIADTIDHMTKGMLLNDCNSCSVKELCSEVEGLRELHKKA